MCFRETENCSFAMIRNNLRISDISGGDDEDPECQICVMGRLSVIKIILFPCH